MEIKQSKLVKKPKHEDLNLKQIDTAGFEYYSPHHRKRSMTERVALYRAALKGNWYAAEKVLLANKSLIRTPITEGGETALHVAALEGHHYFVSKLMGKMDAGDLEILNAKGNTALCFAAAAGHTHITRIMVERSPSLPTIKGENGLMPLYIAAQQGFEETAVYLYPLSNFGSWTPREQIDLLTTVIQSELYGLALSIIDQHRILAIAEDCDGETPLLVLARNPLAFRCNNRHGCWIRIVRNVLPYTISTTQSTDGRVDAYTLLNRLWEAIEITCEEEFEVARSPDRVKSLFVAAECGNDNFLVELLRRDHNFLYKINESKHSIFHIAVRKHYVKVFNLMYELGGMKDLIATYIDTDGNNMLHLAAKLSPKNQLQSIPGAALQMQRDVLWYKAVEKLVRPSYKNMKNKDGLTPHEVFVAEHKSLSKEGEKFMKQTAKACMLVTMLIATVVFTTAFTVPGGYNNSGIPNENDKMFHIFPVSEAVATLSSLTSMLMFLSILTSGYSDDDFLKTLPFWLVVGVASLFISIVAMMVVFCSCLLLFQHGWVLLVFFASVPMIFLVLKYPLLVSVLDCIYSCTYLFRSHNRLHS